MELPKELNDIIEKHAPPPEVQKKLLAMTPRERLEFQCKELDNGEKQLNDYIVTTPCDCWKVRESLKILVESGLTETMRKETFDTYKTPNEWQAIIKQKALDFLSSETPFSILVGLLAVAKQKSALAF